MQAFADRDFKKRDLQKLNWYRLYLQACTFVDILENTGDKVYNLALSGHRNGMRKSLYD